MASSNRILSIDIMRGLTLVLMLFVNDLFVPGVPRWMVHTEADFDGMGLADWVFPGFLFMVGLSIPYAISARKKRNESNQKILFHILWRSVSLIVIGILILNGGNLNPALTGMPKLLWLSLLYVAVFLVWNDYPKKSRYSLWFRIMQAAGLMGLLFLAFVYRSGSAENPGWMDTGWWGILGLIGWGYLTAALVYLVVSGRVMGMVLAWGFFVLLNILTSANIIHFEGIIGKIFGIVLTGNVPSIVLGGLITGMLLRKYAAEKPRLILILFAMGLACIAFGFLLRNWFIISKIYATPSWGMLCNGISLLVLAMIFYITDIRLKSRWGYLFNLAGRNSLTTYLAPDLIYFACWGFGIPLFFYKQVGNMPLTVAGSVIWALVMVIFAYGLSKTGIKLKL